MSDLPAAMERPPLNGVTYKLIGADGCEYGPSDLDELRAWASDGRVGPGTYVWRSDEERWRPAREWPELKWDLPVPAAEPPPVLHPVSMPLRPAGFFPRLAAYLCDAFIVAVLTTLVTLPWSGELSALQDAAMKQVGLPQPDLDVLIRFWWVSLAIHIPLSASYHIGFNARFGATPGKWLGGMRVVGMDDGPLGLRRAAARFVAEAASILPLGFGYLLVAINPDRRALHDLIAGTRVVFRSRP